MSFFGIAARPDDTWGNDWGRSKGEGASRKARTGPGSSSVARDSVKDPLTTKQRRVDRSRKASRKKKKTLGALIIRPQLLTGEGQREEKNWVELPVPQARYWVYSGGVLEI